MVVGFSSIATNIILSTTSREFDIVGGCTIAYTLVKERRMDPYHGPLLVHCSIHRHRGVQALLHLALCLWEVWKHQTTPAAGRVAGMVRWLTLFRFIHCILLLFG